MPVPFVGPSYSLALDRADLQRSINLYPVANEVVGGKDVAYLAPTPGLVLFSEPQAVTGPLFRDAFTGTAGSVTGHTPDVTPPGWTTYVNVGGGAGAPQLDGAGHLVAEDNEVANQNAASASAFLIEPIGFPYTVTVTLRGDTGVDGVTSVLLSNALTDAFVEVDYVRLSVGQFQVSAFIGGTDGDSNSFSGPVLDTIVPVTVVFSVTGVNAATVTIGGGAPNASVVLMPLRFDQLQYALGASPSGGCFIDLVEVAQ